MDPDYIDPDYIDPAELKRRAEQNGGANAKPSRPHLIRVVDNPPRVENLHINPA